MPQIIVKGLKGSWKLITRGFSGFTVAGGSKVKHCTISTNNYLCQKITNESYLCQKITNNQYICQKVLTE